MNITILGAGAWGTALGIHFAKHNHSVAMWTHNAAHAQAMQQSRENERYLPNFRLPDNLNVYADMPEALRGSELVLVVTPVVGLRSSVEQLKQHGGGHLPVLTACKGFELDTGLLTFQVVQEVLPENQRVGVLSGPSFAQELAQQLPCAVCLASENEAWLHGLVQALNTNVMRLYGNSDVIGVSVGGAVKNIMAIATGLSDGLGYGLNARAALVTRGLAEITRLAVAMGAHTKTMMGLAEGKTLHQVLKEIGHVAEGVPTIEEVHNAAAKYQIDMPITDMLYQLVRNELAASDVMERLMQREPKSE